jgi:ElaB/YqjD/DUF883 family membrane-anchored ribosome-binding protein
MANMSNMSSMSNTARDAAKDARDTAKDVGKAAAAGSENVKDDLTSLREDVARLTQQIADIVSSGGNTAWKHARENVEGVISGVETKSQEAIDAVREVGDNVVDAIDESLKQRPYTTLALAVGIGFLFGAAWRR